MPFLQAMELGSQDLIQKPPFFSNPVQCEQTDARATEVPPAPESETLMEAENGSGIVFDRSSFSEEEVRLKEEALLNAVIEIEALIRTTAQAGNDHLENEQGVRPEMKEEVVQSETDFTPVQAETQKKEFAFHSNHAVEMASGQFAESSLTRFGEDLDVPTDVFRRLHSESSSERVVGLSDLARFGFEQAFHGIARAFDDQSEDVRNAAARTLFDLQPDRVASFARMLREGGPDRRRRIGAALAGSGLATIAIGNLAGQSREQGYEAFSLLFLMTKAGEVQPLMRAVEAHPNMEVRLAVVRLLALNGQAEIVPCFRELAVRGVLPSEVRTAVIEAIYDLGRQMPRDIS